MKRPSTKPPVTASRPDADVDSVVELVGTAVSGKAGPLLLVGERTIHLPALDAWPDEVEGRTVRARGFLRRRKVVPDPLDASGAIRQGAWGTQLCLDELSWEPELHGEEG